MIKSRVRNRGTVIAYFLVIVSVLTTGLLTTMALTSGNGAQVAGIELKRDQAYYAAEAGVEQAYWMLQMNNNYRAPADTPLTGSVTNGPTTASFSVTVIGDWNGAVAIKAIGSVGASSSTVTATASPITIVPAISLGNNFDNSGNVTIEGDVQALGNISTSGKLNIKGSLFAGGAITTNGSVDISGSTNPNASGLSTPTIDDIRSQATQIINVPNGSNKWNPPDLNFGNGGIIYMKGGSNTTITFKGNATILGHGTLITDTNVSIQGGASFGTSADPAVVNLVVGGTLDVGGYLGLVGSLVANGSISKNGGLSITGVVVGNFDLDTNGGMQIKRAAPPFFIHYPGINGMGSMKMVSIVGPIF